jgi:hypothetical protein
MTNDPYPFGLGKKRLLFSERAESAKPILLGTRTLEPGDSIHLFAESDAVKTQLEAAIAQSRTLDCRIHPTPIELRSAVYSITFFECVAAEHNGRWGTPKVIEHDNWQHIFWIFLRLFECGCGFLARWEDRYTYMNDLWENERRYKIDELSVRSLTDDCGKSYSTPDGRTLLEYVDKI